MADDHEFEDEMDSFPGERPSRLRMCLHSRACWVVTAILLYLVIYLITIGAFAGGFYAIGKAVAESREHCSCPNVTQCVTNTPRDTFSFDDFDLAPVPAGIPPDLSEEALPHEDIPPTVDLPGGTYHPLLTKHESPALVFRYSTDYVIDRNDPSQNTMVETNEYQITLLNSKFEDRQTGVEELQTLVHRFLDPYISSSEEAKEVVWNEIQYEKKGCGVDFSEMRMRHILTGKHANTSSVDVNKDIKQVKDAVPVTYMPSVNYLDEYEMKLEQDVHVCVAKLNRKLKLKRVPFRTELNCRKCQEFFPNSFYDTEAFDKEPLTVKNNRYLWVFEQNGYLFDGSTKFKTSFTLSYDSYESALIGNKKPDHTSEWSIRIYSLNDGLGAWDEYVLSTMGEFYAYIIENYGSTDAASYGCE